MSSQFFYRTPFASLGDKTAVPNTAVDGSVNYSSGFGPDYELALGTDPDAKAVPRDPFNQILFDITSNLRQYQLFGFPEWVEASQNGGVAVPYSSGAFVRWSGGVWFSLVDTNTAEPGTDPTKWAAFAPAGGTALLAANNLSDVVDKPTARGNLGLGSMATQPTSAWLPKNAATATGGFTVDDGGLTYTGSTKGNVVAVPLLDIDVSAGDFQTKSISANTTFTISGAAAGKGQGVVLRLTISANAVPSWPGNVQWAAATKPQFTNGTHVIGLLTFDGGTTWQGFVGGRNFGVPA